MEIKVDALEYAYKASTTSIPTGSSVRFTVTNTGSVAHEWVLDTVGAHDHGGAHASAMAAILDSALAPGKTASKDVTFAKAGEYEIACHLPGHYEQGMKLTLVVK